MIPPLIFLVGPMGSGKSSVGPRLAEKLSFSYRDLDRSIEQRSGADIATIFSEHGETGFRALEKDALRETLQWKNTVVATGGGVVMDAANRDILSSAMTIWLCAPAGTLWKRLVADGTEKRPLLGQGGLDGYRKRNTIRTPLYRQVAVLRVDVSHRSVDDTAQWIDEWLKTRADTER